MGAKSAQRLAFHVLKTPREDAERLCDAIRDVKDRVTYCSICNNITDIDPCAYLRRRPRATAGVICVVEEPQNVNVVEKTGGFRGIYHVLLGALSPLQGVGPDDLKIKGLLARIGRGRRRGDHPRHQSHRRRRSHRDLPGAAAQAARRARHAHRDRHPGRQRSRYADELTMGEGDGRPARGVDSAFAFCLRCLLLLRFPSFNFPVTPALRDHAACRLPTARRRLLVAGGLLSCFFGYRLFKFVLAIFGFILGALAASSILGASDYHHMVIAAMRRRAGAARCCCWRPTSSAWRWSARASARYRQSDLDADRRRSASVRRRPLLGGRRAARHLAAALRHHPRHRVRRGVDDHRRRRSRSWAIQTAINAAAAGDVWVAYPMNPAPGQAWVPWVFLALGPAGTLVQMYWTGGDGEGWGTRKVKAKKDDQ